MNLVKPDKGTISIFGKPVNGDDEEWKSHLSYQSQQMNGSEGIRAFFSKSFTGYWAKAGLESIEPYGHDYGLDDVLRQIDRGEKQFHLTSLVERGGGEVLLTGPFPDGAFDAVWAMNCLLHSHAVHSQAPYVWDRLDSRIGGRSRGGVPSGEKYPPRYTRVGAEGDCGSVPGAECHPPMV